MISRIPEYYQISDSRQNCWKIPESRKKIAEIPDIGRFLNPGFSGKIMANPGIPETYTTTPHRKYLLPGDYYKAHSLYNHLHLYVWIRKDRRITYWPYFVTVIIFVTTLFHFFSIWLTLFFKLFFQLFLKMSSFFAIPFFKVFSPIVVSTYFLPITKCMCENNYLIPENHRSRKLTRFSMF